MQTSSFCQWNRCVLLGALLFLPSMTARATELSPLRNTRTVQAIRQAEPAVVNIVGHRAIQLYSGELRRRDLKDLDAPDLEMELIEDREV